MVLLTCPEDRLWYTGLPGYRPYPTDVAREKCLAKEHSLYNATEGRTRYLRIYSPVHFPLRYQALYNFVKKYLFF